MDRRLRALPAFVGRVGGILAFVLWIAGVASAPAAGEDVASAGTVEAWGSPAGEPGAGHALPQILSPGDQRLYREIFVLQTSGKWQAADERIARLDDPVLMGHVLAQRYLHPTAYRSKFKELAAWLADYADHPQARRIHRLAMKRRPAGAAKPRAPVAVAMDFALLPEIAPYRSTKKLSRADRRRAYRLKAQVRRNVLRTRLTITENLLAGREARRLLDTVEIDSGLSQVAAGWFYYGNTDNAFRLASQAARRSGRQVPLGLWIAGLSAWRQGKLAAAVAFFDELARSERASSWVRSGGAYWAARGHLRLRNPAATSERLIIAAKYPHTFYGLLAQRALGMDIAVGTQGPGLTRAKVRRLLADPAARRALALVQVGERERAEDELRRLDGDGDRALTTALLALNEAAGFPAFAMRLASGLAQDAGYIVGPEIETGLYPIPPWRPDTGFQVDRALLYAFMRQESHFNPRAKSRRGARGLMQVLPSTANFVVRERRFRGSKRNELYVPEINLDVGQRYITYLLGHEAVGEDLFRLAIAYNGGPGNLARWQREMGEIDDPLMFIESLPSRETRLFIERVLANLWVYRARLGQPLPSLDAIAGGAWPTYTALDRPIQAASRPGRIADRSNSNGAY